MASREVDCLPRLVSSGKQWPVDVAQVVYSLVPVQEVLRLNDPGTHLTLLSDYSLSTIPPNR